MKKDSLILIIGMGSIGERHAAVLQSLGYTNLLALRMRGLPLRNLPEDSIRTVTTWEDALAARPEAAIICTPTSLHREQTIACLHAGWHVLCEKPLHHTSEGLAALADVAKTADKYVQVAYMLRYHPLFVELRQRIESGSLGRLVSQHSYWGEYLPAWHPWEDYRESYAARTDLGGGAALTLSHDVDMALHLAAKPEAIAARIDNHASGLGIEAESGAEVSIRFGDGTTAHCTLSMHDRAPRRWYRYAFTEASVEIDYLAATMTITGTDSQDVMRAEAFDRNDMFRAQWQAFVVACNLSNPGVRAKAQIEQAIQVQKVLES